MEKPKKIELAIDNLKVRIKHVELQIQLLIREKDTFQKVLSDLEAINELKETE